MKPIAVLLFAAAVALLLVADVASAADGCHACNCTCQAEGAKVSSKKAEGAKAQKWSPLKIKGFFSILLCGALGCCLPMLGRRVPALLPRGDVFFLVKAFGAGVILATGFIHILPDAFEKFTIVKFTSKRVPCFPFAGLGAMVGAIGTLTVDTVATGYFTRRHGAEAAAVAVDGGGANGGHVHTHATHGHAHGSTALVAAVGGGESDDRQTLRHRVISQVLELGIVVHSVIIGISLGASDHPREVRPLVFALSFHQMFEGMGLGGCIVQAEFKLRSIVIMVLFFCLTTPVSILIGIAISSLYDENSRTALIVEGILNSVAAGILIYMALVDLLAEDFMNPMVQSRGKLQLGINVSMLLGAGLMSMLAIWA